MMTRMFESLLGKNIEIYIDDMVVKSKKVSEHLGDLQVVFEILRSYKLRLNVSMSWVTWLLTGELKLILTRLKPSTICELLGTQKKCKS